MLFLCEMLNFESFSLVMKIMLKSKFITLIIISHSSIIGISIIVMILLFYITIVIRHRSLFFLVLLLRSSEAHKTLSWRVICRSLSMPLFALFCVADKPHNFRCRLGRRPSDRNGVLDWQELVGPTLGNGIYCIS